MFCCKNGGLIYCKIYDHCIVHYYFSFGHYWCNFFNLVFISTSIFFTIVVFSTILSTYKKCLIPSPETHLDALISSPLFFFPFSIIILCIHELFVWDSGFVDTP